MHVSRSTPANAMPPPEVFGGLTEEIRFAQDLYGAFPVKRLLLGFAHSSLGATRPTAPADLQTELATY
jgi:hypothetical protein